MTDFYDTWEPPAGDFYSGGSEMAPTYSGGAADYGSPNYQPIDYMSLYGQGGASNGVFANPSAPNTQEGTADSGFMSWLQNTYNNVLGPGSVLGGKQGAFPNQQQTGWLGPLMNMASGIYGMSLAAKQRRMAEQAVQNSSPWFSSGGGANAGNRLTAVINGDFANDPGYELAQQAAARSSAQQPGGFSANAAATAALRYQNERIQALGAPAGVGFSPAAGYQLGLSGLGQANSATSAALGTIGYGMSGNQTGIPPWLVAYLRQNGLGG